MAAKKVDLMVDKRDVKTAVQTDSYSVAKTVALDSNSVELRVEKKELQWVEKTDVYLAA